VGQAAIAIDHIRTFSDLQKANLELMMAYDRTISGWAKTLELRDFETEGHSKRVTELAVRLAQSLSYRDTELVNIRRGAMLHDIGKMGIPDNILLKPGKLSEAEWEIMRKHPVIAYDLLSNIDFLLPALDIPHYHHEKWDGSGYPEGLKENLIPEPARILQLWMCGMRCVQIGPIARPGQMMRPWPIFAKNQGLPSIPAWLRSSNAT
jgi:putative nucleotidyltransferase with HDIG domain